MKWNRYTIETTTAAEDLVSSMLCDLGIEGVEIEDNVPLTEADTAKMFIDILPELPPDDGVSRVSFYLDSAEENGEILSQVCEALEELRQYADVGSGAITESQTEDADWINNWKEFFHAFTIENCSVNGGSNPGNGSFGDGSNSEKRDILIKPTWEDLDASDEDKILIEIDPGISFGTGKHETTQLCIRQLMNYVTPGVQVLDLGCGSGILSIVSLKLGAAHVTGTDIDAECLTSTAENFAVNQLAPEQGEFYVGNLIDDEELQERVGTEKYDIVVANILADVIIPMAPVIPARLKKGGIFIASGIIDFKEDEVAAAVKAAGLSLIEVTHQGEWVGITAEKK
ncbi:MAG: 50S ribosomal protein L11 methyltransferase [Clostridiales bacterium]|nr:50S ribosomal protein L11 methyltransferase [Clostridiales bacterium]